jgi:hypothetical protein
MEYLFGKKVFGEDKDNKLVFLIRKMNVDCIKSLEKLCEHNPRQCREVRPEICRKTLELYGYQKQTTDPCSMYIKIVGIINRAKSVKNNLPESSSLAKSHVKVNIKPTKELFNNISIYGDEDVKKYFKKCGFEIPEKPDRPIIMRSTLLRKSSIRSINRSTVKLN